MSETVTGERPHDAPATEFVYLVTVDGEWTVSAIADDHPRTLERVQREVEHRTDSPLASRTRVWRARITDLTEMELTPAHTTGPQLKVKTSDHARDVAEASQLLAACGLTEETK